MTYYGPPPGPPAGGPPPPNRRSHGAMWLTLAAMAAVLLLVVIVLVVAVLAPRDVDGVAVAGESAAPSAASAGPQADTSEPGASSPESSTPAATECLPPKPGPDTPAGWQTVSGKRGLAYDVPPNWLVRSCGTLVGWERKCPDGPFGACPVRVMSSAARMNSPECRNDSPALSGIGGANQARDIDEAMRDESALVGSIYASESGPAPRVELSEPRRLTVAGSPAVQVVATVTGIQTAPCTGPSAIHSMVATTVPGQPGPVVFIISLSQGRPGDADPRIVDQMVTSLRRAD